MIVNINDTQVSVCIRVNPEKTGDPNNIIVSGSSRVTILSISILVTSIMSF